MRASSARLAAASGNAGFSCARNPYETKAARQIDTPGGVGTPPGTRRQIPFRCLRGARGHSRCPILDKHRAGDPPALLLGLHSRCSGRIGFFCWWRGALLLALAPPASARLPRPRGRRRRRRHRLHRRVVGQHQMAHQARQRHPCGARWGQTRRSRHEPEITSSVIRACLATAPGRQGGCCGCVGAPGSHPRRPSPPVSSSPHAQDPPSPTPARTAEPCLREIGSSSGRGQAGDESATVQLRLGVFHPTRYDSTQPAARKAKHETTHAAGEPCGRRPRPRTGHDAGHDDHEQAGRDGARLADVPVGEVAGYGWVRVWVRVGRGGWVVGGWWVGKRVRSGRISGNERQRAATAAAAAPPINCVTRAQLASTGGAQNTTEAVQGGFLAAHAHSQVASARHRAPEQAGHHPLLRHGRTE